MLRFEIRIDKAQKALNKILKKMEPATLLKAIGLQQLRWIAQNFEVEGKESPWRPLSINTLAARKRGKTRILQVTGRLKQSFSYKLIGNTAVNVGSNDKRAPIHHFGTGPYTIVPKNAHLLRFVTASGVRFAKKVHHPGIPKRKLLPSNALASKMARQLIVDIMNNR